MGLVVPRPHGRCLNCQATLTDCLQEAWPAGGARRWKGGLFEALIHACRTQAQSPVVLITCTSLTSEQARHRGEPPRPRSFRCAKVLQPHPSVLSQPGDGPGSPRRAAPGPWLTSATSALPPSVCSSPSDVAVCPPPSVCHRWFCAAALHLQARRGGTMSGKRQFPYYSEVQGFELQRQRLEEDPSMCAVSGLGHLAPLSRPCSMYLPRRCCPCSWLRLHPP